MTYAAFILDSTIEAVSFIEKWKERQTTLAVSTILRSRCFIVEYDKEKIIFISLITISDTFELNFLNGFVRMSIMLGLKKNGYKGKLVKLKKIDLIRFLLNTQKLQ